VVFICFYEGWTTILFQIHDKGTSSIKKWFSWQHGLKLAAAFFILCCTALLIGMALTFPLVYAMVRLQLFSISGNLGTLGKVIFGLSMAVFSIPCLHIGLRIMFFPYFIIDRGVSSRKSFRLSWAATQHHVWILLSFLVLVVGVSGIVGFAFSFTVPFVGTSFVYFCTRIVGSFTGLTMVHIYRKLTA